MTGRLATLEEIVDWQPYDHVGWRLAVPELGPVNATVDLEPVERERTCGCAGTTRATAFDPVVAPRVRDERGAALGRLVRVLES